MILSDRTLKEQLAAGRIVIDPLNEANIQPSSIDLTLDRYFRVFLNHSYPVIDVKEDQEDLTELVEIKPDDRFILHPGEFVLGSTAELVGVPDDLVGRLEGKALAYDTPIPTTRGFTSMEDVRVGDLVFDEHGHPVPVVAATDVMLDRPCARVVFSDGTEIVADLSHQWVVATRHDRPAGRTRVVTTEQMMRSLRGAGEFRYHVPLAGPLTFPRQEGLPIDPYVLGVWLGDGTSTKAEVTTADDESLSSTLRREGLLGDKHVPRRYLYGDVAQRTALLQGLMDADGYVDTSGRCEFVSTKEHLADAVVRLAATLGFRPVKRKKTAYLRGVDCGPAYQVKFTPDRPVFRLPRKLARQKAADARFHRFRAVVAVEPIESVPVKCIQVGSASGVFLAGHTCVPTHNSSLGRLGLLIHSTAGFIDAGFEGHVTLELSNVANLPITLYPGMKIGQISFLQMTSPADHPYGTRGMGSKYQGQRGPTPSRYWENFRD